MATYTCVAIGINRYSFLQPLSYAQADAQALQKFLLEEAEVSCQDCLLLTDASSWIGEKSTYPTRDNIFYWLQYEEDSHSLQFRDQAVVWFFFSGYGVNWQGKDYLMPIDGNLNDISGTGIEIRTLFELLQRKGAKNLVALLDISRSSGIIQGASVGEEAVKLAQEMGITLILSTQIGEFSYEAAALGHGMFSAALLEALRYYRHKLTLADLEAYLRDRLPEFSEHHWRPVQTPVTVIPSDAAREHPILPNTETHLSYWRLTPNFTNSPETQPHLRNVKKTHSTTTLPPIPTHSRNAPSSLTIPANLASNPQTASALTTQNDPFRPFQQWDFSEFASILFWGCGAVLMALIASLVLFGEAEPDSMPFVEAETPIRESELIPEEATQLLDAKAFLQDGNASQFNEAIAQAQQIPPGDPRYEAAQDAINRWSQTIFDIAQGRASQEDFKGAITAARLVPDNRPGLSPQVLSAIEEWLVQAQHQQNSRALINAAQALIQPNQASSYNQGITILRQIRPNTPGYLEAQSLINDWSEQIYLIANSRAAQGNFQQAIETAQLVPDNTPSYTPAQNAVNQWQDNL